MENESFPGREEAVLRQRERLSRLRERVAARMAFDKLRDWFVSSGAAARTADRVAAWIESAASDLSLENKIAEGLSSSAARSAISAVLGAVEAALSDSKRLGEMARPIATWLDSMVSSDDFLWAVHSRLTKMGGATGTIAHLTGAIDYHELTHQTANAIRAELDKLKHGNVSGLKPAVSRMLETIRGFDLSTPESSASLARIAAGLFSASAPGLAAHLRATDPASLPVWLDEILFAAWSRAAAGVVDAIEEAILPGSGDEGTSSWRDLADVMREIVKEG